MNTTLEICLWVLMVVLGSFLAVAIYSLMDVLTHTRKRTRPQTKYTCVRHSSASRVMMQYKREGWHAVEMRERGDYIFITYQKGEK